MIDNSLAQQTAARSRSTGRGLLAAGPAVGLEAAEASGQATPAVAANGEPVVLGGLDQVASGPPVLDGGDGRSFGAVSAGSGTALAGEAIDGIGVRGESMTGTGVFGSTRSTAARASAIFGEITSGTPGAYSAAVRGQNDGTGASGIGVYGSQAGGGWGVYGTSESGIGVNGLACSGVGVAGSSAIGVSGTGTSGGVVGTSSTSHGIGVIAQNFAGGKALKVDGMAVFSRSGVATVAAGRSQVTHRLPLTSASIVLATIQGNAVGLYVRGVTITAGARGSFTIHLSKAAATKTKVAWLTVN